MATVLLIEPDKILANTYAQALRHAGHTVQVAHGAQEAIETADRRTPAVVILELQLAAHDGVEFLHEFRSYAEWRTIPVIIQSSVTPQGIEPIIKMLRHDLGVVAYLYKTTTTLHMLARAVREAMV